MFVCFGFPEQANTDTCRFSSRISMEESRQEFRTDSYRKWVEPSMNVKLLVKLRQLR